MTARSAWFGLALVICGCGAPPEEAHDTVSYTECAPVFDAVSSTVLSSKCADGACHAMDNHGIAVVFEGVSEADLVSSVSANACEGEPLITPGDPDASLFYRKLVDSPPSCGVKMPQVGEIGEGEIACIRAWIAGLQR